MKKVLIISSSPRKGGNSDILAEEFLKGAKEAGNEVEKIFLREKKINYCTGCGYCGTVDYSDCSQKDDMLPILDKMETADVIVFASPIYFYSICGQMKTFIDRLCSRYTKIVNKDFYYILTAADNSKAAIQFALGEFKGLMSCLSGASEQGLIFGGGLWQKGDVLNSDYIEQAYKLGKEV